MSQTKTYKSHVHAKFPIKLYKNLFSSSSLPFSSETALFAVQNMSEMCSELNLKRVAIFKNYKLRFVKNYNTKQQRRGVEIPQPPALRESSTFVSLLRVHRQCSISLVCLLDWCY